MAAERLGCCNARPWLAAIVMGSVWCAAATPQALQQQGLWSAWAAAQAPSAAQEPGTVEASAAALADLHLLKGRGMDWTHAGYREGKAPIPDPPVAFNVKFKQFGAKGDGKTDDTAALQAAVSAANASPKGGVVYLPAGIYMLRRPLTVTQTKVVLRGDGEGKTTIYIPISLSSVFQGTWTTDSKGVVTSAWTAGGGFITFEGQKQRSSLERTLLGTIRSSKPVFRGSRTIPVSTTAKFAKGQRIRIFLNDASTARRGLLAGQPGASAVASAVPSGARLVQQAPPLWVQRDPVYQAAVRGAAVVGEEGVGLTPAQALAADAESAQRSGHGDGADLVHAAADDGTVVAWLYGNNAVFSGPDTGVTNRDEIQCLAIVESVGSGVITLDRPLCFSVVPKWEASIHLDSPSMQDAGVERLTVRFKHSLNMPHHADRGFNAFSVSYAANFWIRDVTILNADNGIFFSWVDRSTVTDVTLGTTQSRVNPKWPSSRNGHHPLCIGESHDNMLKRFLLRNTFIHDVTVTSGSSLNVVMDGKGVDMNLDHHRTAPWGNLFTNLDLGLGTRAFSSGGKKWRGAYSGLLNTYYGLKRSGTGPINLPGCGFGPMLNFVGHFGGDKCTKKMWYVSGLPRKASPNLYIEQRKARLAAAGR